MVSNLNHESESNTMEKKNWMEMGIGLMFEYIISSSLHFDMVKHDVNKWAPVNTRYNCVCMWIFFFKKKSFVRVVHVS